jgi:hypothetical protein
VDNTQPIHLYHRDAVSSVQTVSPGHYWRDGDTLVATTGKWVLRAHPETMAISGVWEVSGTLTALLRRVLDDTSLADGSDSTSSRKTGDREAVTWTRDRVTWQIEICPSQGMYVRKAGTHPCHFPREVLAYVVGCAEAWHARYTPQGTPTAP